VIVRQAANGRTYYRGCLTALPALLRCMFSNPQANPHFVLPCMTSAYFGSPRGVVSRLKPIGPALSRQRSRVRAPSSPPTILNDLEAMATYSDKQIWVQYGCNKNALMQNAGEIHPSFHPDWEPSSLQPCSVRLAYASSRRSINKGKLPGIGLSAVSSSRPFDASCAWPGESENTTTVRALAATRSTLVFHPPRDLPMDCGPFF
jgi:hypothetical protein